jgi:acyl-coenzyme A thioesterase PaaI-like protein
MKANTLRHIINLWPPLFFNAIHVTRISDNFREVDIGLKLRWYNRNNVRTQFGGNLFAMTDPWYMLMLMENLGRDYFVWDKKATIDFISPGRTHVTAKFILTEEKIAEIRAATANGEKYLPEFIVDIYNTKQELVARVHRTVYVKKKPPKIVSP